MNASAPLFISGDGLNLAAELEAMRQSGVRTVRVVFNWASAQPYPNWSQVPAGPAGQYLDVGGVPTDFSESDRIVTLAALYGLRLLPVVLYAPGWDASVNPGGNSSPADPAPYASYLTALIGRYGPRGTFWASYSPSLPIREWQIWNEPNISAYWPQPSAAGYARLLRAAHAAIAAADPGAQTVLAAITNRSWSYLAQLYRSGARSSFDVAAVNPFTSTPTGVIEILRRNRQTMNAHGDRLKPMLAGELGWASARGVPGAHFSWDTTPAGQARNVTRLLPLLAANRRALRLAAFYYYTWVGDESIRNYDWNFAGLERVQNGQVVRKPAFAAFTRAALSIEGCATTGPLPSPCPSRVR